MLRRGPANLRASDWRDPVYTTPSSKRQIRFFRPVIRSVDTAMQMSRIPEIRTRRMFARVEACGSSYGTAKLLGMSNLQVSIPFGKNEIKSVHFQHVYANSNYPCYHAPYDFRLRIRCGSNHQHLPRSLRHDHLDTEWWKACDSVRRRGGLMAGTFRKRACFSWLTRIR